MIDPEIMHRARQARDQLIARFIHHPAVTLIAIGGAPAEDAASETGGVVLKIHVRPDWAGRNPDEPLPFPAEVDGFPVRMVPGEYELKTQAHPDRASPERSSRSVMKLEGGSAMTITRESNTGQGDDHPLSIPELEQVGGIGHKTAQAFNSMGFRSFTELLDYLEHTPTEVICEEMQAHGVGYKPGLFPKDKLVEKVRELTDEREAEQPVEALLETSVEEALDVTARFTVSFSWEPQPDGSRTLCTRVYDERNCGEEVPFYGEDPHPWVAWMLEHANKVLAGPGAPLPASEARAMTEAAQPDDPQEEIQILSADVFELNASPGKPADDLVAHIVCRLSPTGLERAIESGQPCQVKVYLRDLEHDTIQWDAEGRLGFSPGLLSYGYQYKFPTPGLGHYELLTEMELPEVGVARYEGPRFRVSAFVPQAA